MLAAQHEILQILRIYTCNISAFTSILFRRNAFQTLRLRLTYFALILLYFSAFAVRLSRLCTTLQISPLTFRFSFLIRFKFLRFCGYHILLLYVQNSPLLRLYYFAFVTCKFPALLLRLFCKSGVDMLRVCFLKFLENPKPPSPKPFLLPVLHLVIFSVFCSDTI